MTHALKIEVLEISKAKADSIQKVLETFLTDSLDYSADRVSPLECRSRDGFTSFSHNLGGLEAICFRDQWSCCMEFLGSSFPNANETLKKYEQYDVEYFIEKTELKADKSNWVEENYDKFDEYRASDSESNVLFSTDLMLTDSNTLNIRMCVCVKDAPYHRKYDDKLEFTVKFKNISELKAKLKRIANKTNVKAFARQVREGF